MLPSIDKAQLEKKEMALLDERRNELKECSCHIFGDSVVKREPNLMYMGSWLKTMRPEAKAFFEIYRSLHSIEIVGAIY